MNCAKCNADIEQDAQFCPYCGNAVNHGRQCVKCGEHLDDDSDFCPYCGTKQSNSITGAEAEEMKEVPQFQEAKSSQNIEAEEPSIQETHTQNVENDLVDTIPDEDNNGSKKWIFIIVAVLLLGILGGGGYYFMSNKNESPSIVQENDSIPDLQSVEGARQRLGDILSKAFNMGDKEAIHAYFSKEYQELYDKVEKLDNEGYGGEIGFWNGNIWDGGQDGDPNSAEIIQISTSSDTYAYAQVKLTHQDGEYRSENIVSMDLIFENGDWRIADIGGCKGSMKEYISNGQKKEEIIEGYTNILNDYAKKGIDSADGNFYFLHDITGDGYSELWVQLEGDSDGMFNCKLLVYEFKDGNASKIYQEDVGHQAHHSYRLKDNNIYLSFGHMGDSSLSIFEYKDGKIQTREINEDSGSEQSSGQYVETHELTDRESLKYL